MKPMNKRGLEDLALEITLATSKSPAKKARQQLQIVEEQETHVQHLQT